VKPLAPDGLIGSMYELHSKFPTPTSTWIVVAAWKGDGRGKRGRKDIWRVALAPIENAGNRPMFQALWMWRQGLVGAEANQL
jgi:hypothetical protein